VNAALKAVRATEREAYIANRTAKLREGVEKFRASFDSTTPRMENVAALRSTLAGLEEDLAAAIDAAGAEWDRAQQTRRKAEGRAERARCGTGRASPHDRGVAGTSGRAAREVLAMSTTITPRDCWLAGVSELEREEWLEEGHERGWL
jgi:hypothetical protein